MSQMFQKPYKTDKMAMERVHFYSLHQVLNNLIIINHSNLNLIKMKARVNLIHLYKDKIFKEQ